VEGITEYRLPNGVKILLFPDDSKPQFTVNMTVMVGSRHEGYGESGMAHLLEHMLFRGSDRHQDIPKLLKERGVINMNGTTSLDRTNYYETLPATGDNLEFAIGMEADRLINSWIRQEHLSKEMTIVRSEFERGENSPTTILFQRIMDAAFQWHNYGKSTIGNQSDIMRVPAKNLRVFYEKYYQPDNITLVVAGKFDTNEALDLIVKHFGSIEKPTRKLPNTYTEEPAQDGERNVLLRRTGDVQFVGVGYHIPSASNEDYAPLQVLATILSNKPQGPLYKSLVEGELAASAGAFARVGHDPGLMLAYAEVPKEKDLVVAKDNLIEQLETLPASKVTDDDVKRAVRKLLKGRERQFANSEQFATALTEWESYGDWRLYFLHRDRLEKVAPEAVLEVAKKYLIQSNRTVGMFFPTEEPVRASIDAQNFVKKMVDGYQGRKLLSVGEAFDPSPANIQKRSTTGTLDSGLKYALLPKETRGDRVVAKIALHYGDENSLKGKHAAADFLPSLMARGTKQLAYQAYRDRLDELKASVSISGSIGQLSVGIETEHDNLVEVLEVVRQALREPLLEADQLEILRTEQLTNLESGLSDPQSLAITAMQREIDPQPADDVRYTATIPETIDRCKALQIDDVRQLHADFLGGEHGEVAVVGDFDAESVLSKLNEMFAGWSAKQPYEKIEQVAYLDSEAKRVTIETPDKANAFFITARTCEVGDDHPDYEAALIGDYIMGGGPLSSRIADRVRKKEGLSYTAITRFSGSSDNDRGSFFILCISKPTNTPAVISTVAEEVDLMLSTGVTAEELTAAKTSYLQNRKGKRAKDSVIASTLISNMRNGRTMDFQQASDDKIETLTKAEVDAALKKVMDPAKMVTITAGDFSTDKTEPPMDK
jgi:zinc protease